MVGPGNNLGDDALIRLLRALAGEIGLLAEEIARVGEALTAEHVSRREGASVHLQMFDIIVQSAQAHAKLLGKLIAAGQTWAPTTDTELKTHIEDVPFEEVRRRLLTAMEGIPQSEGPTTATTDIWLPCDRKASG